MSRTAIRYNSPACGCSVQHWQVQGSLGKFTRPFNRDDKVIE